MGERWEPVTRLPPPFIILFLFISPYFYRLLFIFIRKLIVPFLVISALFDLLLIHFEPMAQKERALTLGASARLTS